MSSRLRLVDLVINWLYLSRCIYLERSALCDVAFLLSCIPLYAFSGPERDCLMLTHYKPLASYSSD